MKDKKIEKLDRDDYVKLSRIMCRDYKLELKKAHSPIPEIEPENFEEGAWQILVWDKINEIINYLNQTNKARGK